MEQQPDGLIERILRNKWLQLLLAVAGLAGLAALVVPLFVDDGSLSEYSVLAAEPGGAPATGSATAVYAGGQILRTWSGEDGRGPSPWRSGGAVSIHGVVSERNLVATVTPGSPAGIELEFPDGTVAMKLIAAQVGEPEHPLTFTFRLGDEVFLSTVRGNDSPVGVTLEPPPGVTSVRLDVAMGDDAPSGAELDAVLAFSRVELSGS